MLFWTMAGAAAEEAYATAEVSTVSSIGALIITFLPLLFFIAPAIIIPVAITKSRKKRLAAQKEAGLKSCPTCGKTVSVRAASCPHCGEPLIPETDSPKEQ
ncbi:MAG: zinc ribbon domain-containing protein [Clostridia bacterium]|nr:zinc ribbon domain-containing protein [Clostridia bacterium]